MCTSHIFNINVVLYYDYTVNSSDDILKVTDFEHQLFKDFFEAEQTKSLEELFTINEEKESLGINNGYQVLRNSYDLERVAVYLYQI